MLTIAETAERLMTAGEAAEALRLDLLTIA